ncbi:9833_t:CDS:1, partial [Ambispora leptoticha]
MVNSRLEAQRQTILHYWLSGVQSAKRYIKKTNIPLRTVTYNLKKIQGNGRPSKVTQSVARAIGQY